MSRSTDPGHFFQTDASESTRARRAAKSGNKNGNPIVLQSKILSVTPDPFSPACIYIAESAGCVRRVNIETRDSKTVYRGPTAPVTSVAVGGHGGSTIFAGCWDKDIWTWNRESRSLGKKFKGHSDFVKVVIAGKVEGKDILISGGADSKIIVWDSTTGERLHTLRDKSDNMMAVQDLALDPVESTVAELVLVSSSSDPHIRRWRISLSSAAQIFDSVQEESTQNKVTRDTILEHETSVYQISFSGEEDDVDLWTASADGTAKCLSRARNWSAEDSYQHGDYVRAVAVTDDWVITAGRDEDVKVWDRATGKLWHTYEGHYEEVTGLVVLEDGRKVISVSIDGTVRTWGLGRADLEKARKEREEESKGVVKDEKVPEKKSLLTAEEEAELAELMDSGDE
ncbi:WD40 repeat-like protein [Mollisia scopiformis]|uniref:WD40 repeat-like protein n=1 Tax=Mollisia scopiformis TaxID=149040 RepID=A0A132B7X3_MOLSC|nr:WD40 repeat-like protein [Mollisia scopiformis]KUJ08510.1 WD40 repeat-like protein [Mollisia scopiformis]